jgi:hypothetical protein
MENSKRKPTKAQAERLFTLRSQLNAMMTAAEMLEKAGKSVVALMDKMHGNENEQFELLVKVTGLTYKAVADKFHSKTMSAACRFNGKVLAAR